jgi:hypothetical protein
MDFFRKHHKLFVWILIGCFLLYLVPSVVMMGGN